ncbi:MAG: hypothetical protein IJC52_05980 [Clostridia bacterium]|nr:hypothetical protein [Clostridia bacterium]
MIRLANALTHTTAVLVLVLFLMATVGCSAVPTLPDETIERFEYQPHVASLPKDYTIAQMCEESTLVVVGSVTNRRDIACPVDENPDRNYSQATVKIEDVLLGSADIGHKILVRDSLYIDKESGIEATAWGAPMMHKGHRVLLFLEPDNYPVADEKRPVYTALYGELGKFFADEQGLFYPAVSLSKSYKNGNPHMTLDNMEPRTLEEIRQEIEGAEVK